jgi:hypothetical protein
VSDDVEATQTDWMAQLLRSVTEAGLAKTAVPAGDETEKAPSPSSTPSSAR